MIKMLELRRCKLKVIGIPLLIILVLLSIGLNLLSSHYKKTEFSSFISVTLEQEGNQFSFVADLEPNIQYALVTSGEFNSGFSTEYAKKPLFTLNGGVIFLEGGESLIDKNLVLDWQWVKKSKIEFEKRYYGFFSVNESCNCLMKLKGLMPENIKDYKVSLYKEVDESYFLYGWIEAISIYVTIFFGIAYLLIEFLKGLKFFYLEKKKWILGKF